MNWNWLWWIGVALVLAVIEMLTVDFMFIMLAGGAAAAALTGALGAPFWLQAVVGVVVAVLLVFLVRPWAQKRLRDSTPDAKAGIDAVIGRAATVVSDVTDRAGRVKLHGEVWTARTEIPGVVLRAGQVVTVVRIDGATAVVAPQHVTDPSQPYG